MLRSGMVAVFGALACLAAAERGALPPIPAAVVIDASTESARAAGLGELHRLESEIAGMAQRLANLERMRAQVNDGALDAIFAWMDRWITTYTPYQIPTHLDLRRVPDQVDLYAHGWRTTYGFWVTDPTPDWLKAIYRLKRIERDLYAKRDDLVVAIQDLEALRDRLASQLGMPIPPSVLPP